MTQPRSAPDWLLRVAETAHRHEPLVQMLGKFPGGRQSAVLMLFGPNADGGEDIVVTERSQSLRKHPGQVSFPGGGIDPEDDGPVGAAMREAREEVGLSPEGVQVLGEMPRLPLSVTGFTVTPVLAWWTHPSQIGVVDEGEVAKVVRLSVADLVDPAHRFTAVHPSRRFNAPAFEVDDIYIWGFTAILLSETLDLAGLSRPWDTHDLRPVPECFLAP